MNELEIALDANGRGIVEHQGVSADAAKTYRDATAEVLQRLAQAVQTSELELNRFSQNVGDVMTLIIGADSYAEEQARAALSEVHSSSGRQFSNSGSTFTSPSGSAMASGAGTNNGRAVGTSGVDTGK